MLNVEYRTSNQILIALLNICFWVRAVSGDFSQETLLLPTQNICLIGKQIRIHLGIYFYCYLPIIRTTDNSK